VPGMFLSRTLPQSEGLACAMGLYVSDSVVDSAVALRSAMLQARFKEVSDAKAAANQLAVAACPPKPPALTARNRPRDTHRHARESLGMYRAHLHILVESLEYDKRDHSLSQNSSKDVERKNVSGPDV
jgi:hypothetical protein